MTLSGFFPFSAPYWSVFQKFGVLLDCSGLLTVGKLTRLENTVGEVNRVEIPSILIHSTGQDWLTVQVETIYTLTI